MATTKQLADLEAGDTIKTNEGRREWLRIVNIGPVDTRSVPLRRALVEQCGGQRAGSRFPINLHDYEQGWTVR